MADATRPCPYCGERMSNPQQVTCKAIECKRKQNAKLSLERYHQAKRGEVQQHLCKRCSEPVTRPGSCGPWPTYCSEECREASKRAVQKERVAAEKAARPVRDCDYCGQSLPTDARPYRRFCSFLCQSRKKRGTQLPTAARTCAECSTGLPDDAPLIQMYCGVRCKSKVTYRRHAEKNRTVAAAWREANREHYTIWQAAYRERTRDKRIADSRAAYAADPLRYKNARDLRRTRLRDHPDSVPVCQRDWDRLLRRYDGRCAYCGSDDRVTIEHVVPVSRGGRHGIGNVLPACWPCNHSKSNKLLVEWRRFLMWTGASNAMEAVPSG